MELRRRLTRWGVAPLLVVFSAVAFGGCGPGTTAGEHTPSILNPSGPVALKESYLFWFILVVATIVFVGVTGVLLYSIWRFRERPGMPAPRQISGNTALEIGWTILPAVILFIVLIGTIYTMVQITQPAQAQTLTVSAIGHQWWWEFRYPGYNNINPGSNEVAVVVTGDELHVPVGMVVHVDLQSNNVIHSFWIPELAGKTDVIPGHDNTMWFQADRPGTYRGECAEYCGTQHANMDFVVVAQSPGDFATWLQAQETVALAPSTDIQKAGQHDFLTLGCAACHSISGTIAAAQIGPNLSHFGSRQLIAGGVLSNTPENLATWLNDPQAVKPGNDMVLPEKLNSTQIDELVQYLESLK